MTHEIHKTATSMLLSIEFVCLLIIIIMPLPQFIVYLAGKISAQEVRDSRFLWWWNL